MNEVMTKYCLIYVNPEDKEDVYYLAYLNDNSKRKLSFIVRDCQYVGTVFDTIDEAQDYLNKREEIEACMLGSDLEKIMGWSFSIAVMHTTIDFLLN